jgi:hypothetical protein
VCAFLVIQHAKRLSRITRTLLSVAYNVLSHYLKKGTNFEKKVIELQKAVWFSLQLMSESLILRRTKRDVTINAHRSASAAPDFLVRL